MSAYPKYAIKTESELKKLKGKFVYLVYPESWGDEPLQKFKLMGFRPHSVTGDGTYNIDLKSASDKDCNPSYWLRKGRAGIPEADTVEECDGPRMTYTYIFTDYWQAYAYMLRTRSK